MQSRFGYPEGQDSDYQDTNERCPETKRFLLSGSVLSVLP